MPSTGQCRDPPCLPPGYIDVLWSARRLVQPLEHSSCVHLVRSPLLRTSSYSVSTPPGDLRQRCTFFSLFRNRFRARLFALPLLFLIIWFCLWCLLFFIFSLFHLPPGRPVFPDEVCSKFRARFPVALFLMLKVGGGWRFTDRSASFQWRPACLAFFSRLCFHETGANTLFPLGQTCFPVPLPRP